MKALPPMPGGAGLDRTRPATYRALLAASGGTIDKIAALPG
ncbi:hypothetical protein [Novosphingobium mangrovi (ex Huang et al. 2023)]|uniref:Uncharacterized protein n=1 Tax=Novosphingobium mangrovi (ex Huang et al. 2023) TaxID=2976432 RepID=A0ABT2I2S6_9SPHN|nr:hypothetical protein [Novosphingobium mangrovi (ex Huang et al. 2023)]MCT2399107.1 hypothetical protein [Novosphingobium mangrovi (ex Huang et al. 2023)]